MRSFSYCIDHTSVLVIFIIPLFSHETSENSENSCANVARDFPALLYNKQVSQPAKASCDTPL